MKKLALKNAFFWPVPEFDILSLQKWLEDLSLDGKQSRQRTRFLMLISDRINEMAKERERLFAEYGAKDKKTGKLIFQGPEGHESINPEPNMHLKIKESKKALDLNREFTEYLEEDLILDVSPQTKDTINAVKKIILNTKDEFKGPMASRYNQWCEAFESIK